MSRKPVDQQQPTECRQAIWDQIRAQNGAVFTLGDIAMHVHLDESSIQEYLQGLTAAGYLLAKKEPLGKGSLTIVHYCLARNVGYMAPRVRKNGSVVTMGRGRQQMWRVLPVLKTFTVVDLAYNASTPEHTVPETEAKDYIGHLHRAGYLIPAAPAKAGKRQLWKLKPGMWTGPYPPQVQRTKQVYDPNLQRVVWSRITGGAE